MKHSLSGAADLACPQSGSILRITANSPNSIPVTILPPVLSTLLPALSSALALCRSQGFSVAPARATCPLATPAKKRFVAVSHVSSGVPSFSVFSVLNLSFRRYFFSSAPGITPGNGALIFSFNSGCGIAFRGSICSRIAALYTKIASTSAACAKSSACSLSYTSIFE
jgi:hypothetical protein